VLEHDARARTAARTTAALNRHLRLIIEQDIYPARAGSAKAIAARTRDYFTRLGLPPAED
jgi:inosose dehydratase